jgi:hypothetical protein
MAFFVVFGVLMEFWCDSVVFSFWFIPVLLVVLWLFYRGVEVALVTTKVFFL